jgi:hypothetical protein
VSVDEDEDGSVIVTGGFEGSTHLFGQSTTSNANRSLLLARLSPKGEVLWKTLFGRKLTQRNSSNTGEFVLSLEGGKFALAGFHGEGFDLGGGTPPPGRGTDVGFVAILRADGSPVFAENFDTIGTDKGPILQGVPPRPLGLHPDGQGGVWALAARANDPLGAVRISAAGQVLARVTYPVVVRFDTPDGTLSLRSPHTPDRPLGIYRGNTIQVSRVLSVDRNGSLFVVDADDKLQGRGLVLHRFTPAGALTDVQLEAPVPGLSYTRGFPVAGPNGEVYVASSTTQIVSHSAIVGSQVIPKLLTTIARVQRVDPDGRVRWTWTAGPRTNLVMLRAVVARNGRVRVLLTYRDNLEAAPGLMLPTPEKQGLDAAGQPGLAALTFDEHGRVVSLDGMAPPGPCPRWMPVSVMESAAIGRSITVLAPARDADKPGECNVGFGFNGGYVMALIPLSAPH